MAGTLLSIGHGYSARALGRLLLARGWRVIGTTRDPERAAALRAEGVEAALWPLENPAAAVAACDHVLSSAAPDAQGDPALRALGPLLAARAPRIRWAGYLSTTGVYGHHRGDWVDEATALDPSTDRGRARVAAEAAWRALAEASGLPLHVFRLAGIYGPGRGPFQKVLSGQARRIVKPGQVFSRIHVDDIAATLLASIDRPDPGAIYNVCDDEPAPPEDVLSEAARLLGLPPPPEVAWDEAEMTPMARSFYAESKRVSNRRIRDELGVRLSHPTYREGLAAVMAAEGGGAL
jgi:nucleoside-diphosphate-sugar epimerase